MGQVSAGWTERVGRPVDDEGADRAKVCEGIVGGESGRAEVAFAGTDGFGTEVL